MFAELDLPWGLSSLPVVDLSTLITGASQKKAKGRISVQQFEPGEERGVIVSCVRCRARPPKQVTTC